MAQFNSLLVTGDSSFLNPINGNAKNGVYNVIGTQASATSAWTGLLPIPSLYTGLQINYFLPYASTSTAVTLALTLSTGVASSAIDCYVDGTTRLSNQYTSGNTITLTYYASGDISIDGTATSAARWVVSADANTSPTVVDSDPTLAWGTQSTVATIDGTAIHVTMPSNPDTDTHRPIQVEGTEILGDNTTPLNFVAGTNVTFSDDGSGSLTITSNNTNAITQNYSTVTAGGNGIKQYSLFARLPDGTYSSFTTNGGTSAKTFDSTNYFDIRKIYQANASSAIAAGSTIGTTVMRYCIGSFDFRYSFTGVTTSASSSSMTGGLPVYLVFDPTQCSSGYYKLKSPYYTQTPNDTSAIYVLIGYMRDSYRCSIWPSNLAFIYDGIKFIPFPTINTPPVSGTYTLADQVAAGYIDSTGNYFIFSIPFAHYAGTVSLSTIDNSGGVQLLVGGSILTSGFIDTNDCTILSSAHNCPITFKCKLVTAQTPNTSCTVVLGTSAIVISLTA